jgi:hypothetical protein
LRIFIKRLENWSTQTPFTCKFQEFLMSLHEFCNERKFHLFQKINKWKFLQLLEVVKIIREYAIRKCSKKHALTKYPAAQPINHQNCWNGITQVLEWLIHAGMNGSMDWTNCLHLRSNDPVEEGSSNKVVVSIPGS